MKQSLSKYEKYIYLYLYFEAFGTTVQYLLSTEKIFFINRDTNTQ